MFSKRQPLVFSGEEPEPDRSGSEPLDTVPSFRMLEPDPLSAADIAGPPCVSKPPDASKELSSDQAGASGEMSRPELAFPRFAPPPPPAPSVSPPVADERGGALPVYAWALVASLAWTGALAALAFAYPQTVAPAFKGPLAVAALLAILTAPMALLWSAAFALASARGLLAESRRARRFSEALAGPAAAAAAGATQAAAALQAQLDQTARTATATAESVGGLRQVLATEVERLAAAGSAADMAAGKLVVSLSGQRTDLSALAVTLEARAAAVTDAIGRQSAMVSDASDLAETQLAEAQALLAARSADLAAGAIRVGEAARAVAEDLARQTARLEAAGQTVGDQLRLTEEGLAQQRAGVVAIAHGLRADQEELAALSESRAAQLSAVVASAAKEARALGDAAAQGAAATTDILEEAAARQAELTAVVQAERAGFEEAARVAAAALADAAGAQRASLEAELEALRSTLSVALADSAAAAKAHGETARLGLEQMNEAVFAVGQSADRAFEDRLAECRALIESSARLIDEAGERAAARLGEALAAANGSIGELNALARETLAAVAALPAEARTRGEEVRSVLAGAMDALMASARRTAEETQSIDQAFQERVRRNYEMLSEAVQLMGVVAKSGQAASAPRPPRMPSPAQTPQSDPAPAPADALGLRPRIRLTAPAEASAPARDGGADESEGEGERRWSDLLHGAGNEDGGIASEGPSPFHEIAAMGIDPAALLSRARIEEIAAAIQAGDEAGAREVVRTLAPAATRRLSRRIMAEAPFAGMAAGFVDAYGARVRRAAKSDPQGFQAASLLTSDAGRAWLLLEASRLGAG